MKAFTCVLTRTNGGPGHQGHKRKRTMHAHMHARQRTSVPRVCKRPCHHAKGTRCCRKHAFHSAPSHTHTHTHTRTLILHVHHTKSSHRQPWSPGGGRPISIPGPALQPCPPVRLGAQQGTGHGTRTHARTHTRAHTTHGALLLVHCWTCTDRPTPHETRRASRSIHPHTHTHTHTHMHTHARAPRLATGTHMHVTHNADNTHARARTRASARQSLARWFPTPHTAHPSFFSAFRKRLKMII